MKITKNKAKNNGNPDPSSDERKTYLIVFSLFKGNETRGVSSTNTRSAVLDGFAKGDNQYRQIYCKSRYKRALCNNVDREKRKHTMRSRIHQDSGQPSQA